MLRTGIRHSLTALFAVTASMVMPGIVRPSGEADYHNPQRVWGRLEATEKPLNILVTDAKSPHNPGRALANPIILKPIDPKDSPVTNRSIYERGRYLELSKKLADEMRALKPQEAAQLDRMRGPVKPVKLTRDEIEQNKLCLDLAEQEVSNIPCLELKRNISIKNELALVDQVNKRFNQRIQYVSDKYNYDDDQSAAVTVKRRKGDCEDYAIAKYVALRRANIPADRLFIAHLDVTPEKSDGGHVALLYRGLDNEWRALDNALVDEGYKSKSFIIRAYFRAFKAPFAIYNENKAWYNPDMSESPSFGPYYKMAGPPGFAPYPEETEAKPQTPEA